MAAAPATPSRASKQIFWLSRDINEQSSHFCRSKRKTLTRSARNKSLTSRASKFISGTSSRSECIRLMVDINADILVSVIIEASIGLVLHQTSLAHRVSHRQNDCQ